MIHFLSSKELQDFPRLQRTMFRDRAEQFKIRLKWDVRVNSYGEEYDSYDAMNPIYVILKGPDGSHRGSMRLMPTTGPCMLNDHFHHLIPSGTLADERIWECTRFCVNPKFGDKVAPILMLAGSVFMEKMNLTHFAGVFDRPMERIYSRIGASPQIISSRGTGIRKVSFGLWKYSKEAKLALEEKIGQESRKFENIIPKSPSEDKIPTHSNGKILEPLMAS